MLSPELKKLMISLENGNTPEQIDPKALLRELQNLDEIMTWEPIQESLSLSSAVCPRCGRKL